MEILDTEQHTSIVIRTVSVVLSECLYLQIILDIIEDVPIEVYNYDYRSIMHYCLTQFFRVFLSLCFCPY